MAKRDLVVFEEGGKQNTDVTLQAAVERAKALGIKQVVVASSSGWTATRAAEAFADTGVKIVAVTLHAGTWQKWGAPNADLVRRAQSAGVTVVTATHAFMGNVATAIQEKFGGIGGTNLISYVYYTLGQGMKVAVECALMAADAGLLDMAKEAITIAGTGEGADTAIVVKPAFTTNFFDLRIREVIAMTRTG